MGPFSGRDEIKDEVTGIMLNPNCEFELNFIPIRSFSEYCGENLIVDRDNYSDHLDEWYNQFNESITKDELKLLTDSFHLPHELGEMGIRAKIGRASCRERV